MLRDSETRMRPSWLLLGPAFVAAIAYVDPGNVAANISAGAQFGFLLVWVIFLANAMAGLVQYLSAKLGLVSGRTLPEAVADHTRTPTRIAYWLQAETVAMATDLAEVVGGAIALHLLFDLPLLVGGVITGAVSLLLLAVQNRRGQRTFERVISGLLLVIAIGFLTSLFVEPPPLADAAEGLVPRFDGAESVLLATAMLGATVMPHAVYLHSGLARDRHGHPDAGPQRKWLLKVTRVDVGLAMLVAGAVNLSMVLVAATNLQGRDDTDSIEGAHAAVRDTLGPTVALFFAIGLLASGLASTSVGAYAGAMIMQGLLRRTYPLLRASPRHPHPRAGDPCDRHRPQPRTGDIAGRAVVRDPVRPHSADSPDQRSRADGRRHQPPGHHRARLARRRDDHRAQRRADLPDRLGLTRPIP